MKMFHRSLRLIFAVACSLGLLLTFFGVASAQALHAKVIQSDPKMGSTIPQAPTSVTVTTAENMKPGPTFSNLYVYGPDGALISQGDAKVGLSDPNHMSVAIKPEKNGVYVVQWKTVSASDGDPDQGAFTFTVGTAAAASTITPPPPTTTNDSGIPWYTTAAVGIAALLIGGGIGLGIGRSRKPSPVATIPESEYNRQ
jgi:copper resistance protein C